ncbi:MAG: hypothetical protein H6744_05655 [Deltaproteobacteria bacterium]|nr:hypothetical protein [Deltaproteobacteria bacterium]MCB9786165.1 hypothetical protein [Deltaproteobacteria bacterium]
METPSSSQITGALATLSDPERLAELRDNAVQQIQQADGRFRELCREHPFAVLAGAAAAGYLLGRILSR